MALFVYLMLLLTATITVTLFVTGLPFASARHLVSVDTESDPGDFTESPWAPNTDLNVRWEDCYEKKCRCKRPDQADCSYSNLTFIPELPPYVLFLNFTNNQLHAIKDEDFFANITRLVGVNVAYNELRAVNSRAFTSLTNLSYLILAFNEQLKFDHVAFTFTIQTLKLLDIRLCGLGQLPNDLFQRHPMPNLQKLYLHQNAVRHMNSTTFSFLPQLQQLGLASNSITWIHAHKLRNLAKLNLNDNALSYFPRSCNYSSSLFPKLTYVNLARNKISKLSKKICLPAVRFLDLSDNQFPEFVTDMFSDTLFPALNYLTLENNLHIKGIQKYAFRNTNLQFLTLMYNNLDFSREFVDLQSFHGCPSLTNLQISHNVVSPKPFERLFGNLTSLQKLEMGQCNIKEISVDMFAGLTSLVNLSLYNNELTSIPDGVFDKLENLQDVDLSNNLISVVFETTFNADTRRRLRRLDLSGNRFQCSCDLQWFRKWLISEPALFGNSWSGYDCFKLPNTSVALFHIVEQTCLLNAEASLLVSVTIGLLILTMTVTSLLYRYRWHIRLVLHEAFRGRGDRWRRLQTEQFQFDVFVSYAAEDLWFMRDHLLPELEEKRGLRLCIHERDFILGYPIVDNIADSVEASKKILVLFSRDFTRSQWCQFELRFCLNHVLTHDDSLLVVLLQDLGSRDLTSAMMAVLSTTTYIQWDEDSDAKRSFWGRIQIALHEVLPASYRRGLQT